jgi:hypothetical protein
MKMGTSGGGDSCGGDLEIGKGGGGRYPFM